jgi:8-oxo-dGTP pyrophosphatase MutT (NUDIX family)
MAKDAPKNFLNIMVNNNNPEFQNLMFKISQRLKLPLPGNDAHKLMEASSRNAFNKGPNDLTRKSAVLILFYPAENDIHIPLILRPKYEGMHGWQVAFPGGRNEKTDENLIRTALREAQEEIGIRTADVTVIGQLTELYIPPSNYLVQPVVGFLNFKPMYYPDPREVELVFEAKLTELSDPKIISDELIEMKGIEIKAPSYKINGQTIWGATAMMFAELLLVIEQSNEIK